MREIRRLQPEELRDYAYIHARAYPGMGSITPEDIEKYVERLEKREAEGPSAFYGVFEDGRQLGGLQLYDYQMNFHGATVLAGGIGDVAVDLVQKKRSVAYDMMKWAVRHQKESGAVFSILYPFRHDFYRKMGYGYGVRSYHYEVRTAALPDSPLRRNVDYLTRDDIPAVLECYNRIARQTHGMTLKIASEIEGYFRQGNTVVGYKEDGKLLGTMVFTFKKGPRDNVLCNHIVVRDWDYDRSSLAGFFGFLRAQADQIERVVIDTQDETLFYMFNDPYNEAYRFLSPVYQESSAHGLGLMYRVLDIDKAFAALSARDFGGASFAAHLIIEDSFMPDNARSTCVVFEKGKARIEPGASSNVDVSLDIGDFSSWMMGAVNLGKLYQYGRAQVSDEKWIHALDRAFIAVEKPRCMAHF